MAPKQLEELLKYDKIEDDEVDDFCEIFEQVEIDSEKDVSNLQKALKITKYVTLKLFQENKVSLDLFQEESSKALKREQDLREELEYAQKQMTFYQTDPKLLGTTDALEIDNLKSKNKELSNDLKNAEEKLYLEKNEKDKLKSRVEELDNKIKRLSRENERLEEEIKDFERTRNQYLEQKYRAGPDQEKNVELIRQKNKTINELEAMIDELNRDNQNLNKIIENSKLDLQDSTAEMIKTREEIKKLRLIQEMTDSKMDEFKKENEILKSQIANYNTLLKSHSDQESAIMIKVDNAIKEYKEIIEDKKHEIDHLNDIINQLRENLGRQNMDTDKVTVTALQKALQTKDKEIEVLKNQIQESTREMEKSRTVIDALNKTLFENSKLYSKSAHYNINKQAEQKIIYLENLVKESDTRLKEVEQQAASKERELVEALNKVRDYESGDYQLQQAVNEIKGLKNQIKVRDRDIENLTKHLNKLDVTLNDVLEENDDLRAKLGMEPKEKINLEELNNLRAIRAQENRAHIYVLQKENENLLEVQTQLRKKIRLLAKQIRSKEIVASILEEDGLDYYDDLIESKAANKNKDANKSSEKSMSNQVIDPKILRENEFMKKRNEQQLQLLLELENENNLLQKSLIEFNDQLKNTKHKDFKGKGKEMVLKCPSIDKLLTELESVKALRANVKSYSFLNQILADGSGDAITLALKSEIDFQQGRNEELRAEILQLKSDFNKAQSSLIKAQDEIDRLNSDVRIMNENSAIKDIFHPFKLPPGLSPSSQDIISALNEYLIITLQELEDHRKISNDAEKELESLKRKFAVSRHQLSILYKEYINENNEWKKEKENLENKIKKLSDKLSIDSVKLQEYDRLLETLEKDESIIRTRIAESSRQMFVLRSSEKKLQRKLDSFEEINSLITKENKKLKVELVEAEIAVQKRIGYLERFKDLANFKIKSLQNQLTESVSVSKLDIVNREYNELVQNYRQLLDKQENREELNMNLIKTEELNKKYENEIEFLKRELENTKEKSNILEETLNRMKTMSVPIYGSVLQSEAFKLDPTTQDNSMLSMAKRLTALEMKELNERQKADHAQKMYDQQRNILREIENRNIELENNFTQLSKKYLSLEKSEQSLREQLTHYVPKKVNDQDKERIKELEKQENFLKTEISRLRELTEVTLYQASSIEFINNISKAQLENIKLIDAQALNDDTNQIGKLHRQLIMMQISEATAVRKLQQSEARCRKLEAQLIRAEQKYDKENSEFYSSKKEYISKISYLRSTVQDLRHKYAGSIPLRQQEKFNDEKEKLTQIKKELNLKLMKINEDKYELEDRIAEYNLKIKEIDILKESVIRDSEGTILKFNDKVLESYKKSENLKLASLKLERANRRLKDEIKFLEEINRKHEIAIISLEEQNLRIETDFDQRMLIWEHREADLERTIDHLKKQHQIIENLAINFEEISGNMPDQSLPIANQLDQAMNIIRSHIKLLAEAKVQADLSKKRVQELETQNRKLENEVNIRDKAITELRLRLPAAMERDLLVKSSMNQSFNTDTSNTPVKAAQATIESLQALIKQKEDTILKYQDMLKLARDEIANINKQHELEINNLLDKLNLTRDTNIQKLRQELKFTKADQPITTRAQLGRLQELEEVTVEQDNIISALKQQIKKLNTEIDTWKARHEIQLQNHAQELANSKNDQMKIVEKLNSELAEYRNKIAEKEQDINKVLVDLENQKQLNNQSPTAEIKKLVDKLKQQLTEKDEQQKVLNKALADLRSDLVDLAKNNLTSMKNDHSHEQKIKEMIEKSSGEYQDKIYSLSEELLKIKKELKEKTKINEELSLELNHIKSQNKTKDQKIKKLNDENQKLIEDAKHFATNKSIQNFSNENKSNDIENLKRHIRILEDKLKRQKLNTAERPYDDDSFKPRSKSPKRTEFDKETKLIIKTVQSKEDKSNSENYYSVKNELEQWKTRYNYVLSENVVLLRQKNDLEVEVTRLRREVSINSVEVLKENNYLRDELEKLKSKKIRTFSPNSKLSDIRTENKNQINSELQKLKQENELLKQKAKRVDELEKYVEYLKSERSKNDDAESTTSSTSSIKRIGESGKSTKELEKTIALMKKIIVKLQNENENLKIGLPK